MFKDKVSFGFAYDAVLLVHEFRITIGIAILAAKSLIGRSIKRIASHKARPPPLERVYSSWSLTIVAWFARLFLLHGSGFKKL